MFKPTHPRHPGWYSQANTKTPSAQGKTKAYWKGSPWKSVWFLLLYYNLPWFLNLRNTSSCLITQYESLLFFYSQKWCLKINYWKFLGINRSTTLHFDGTGLWCLRWYSIIQPSRLLYNYRYTWNITNLTLREKKRGFCSPPTSFNFKFLADLDLLIEFLENCISLY